ncbi:hypothetical protein ACFX11_029972 [Malus domestica]
MSTVIQWTTVGMVATWYGSNIGILLLNKYLLTNCGFRFSIFLTLCHMTVCSVLNYVAIAVMKVARLQSLKSNVQLAKISGLSVVFCFSVVSTPLLSQQLLIRLSSSALQCSQKADNQDLEYSEVVECSAILKRTFGGAIGYSSGEALIPRAGSLRSLCVSLIILLGRLLFAIKSLLLLLRVGGLQKPKTQKLSLSVKIRS